MVDQGISVGNEQDMVGSLHVVIPVPIELHLPQDTRAAIDTSPFVYTYRKDSVASSSEETFVRLVFRLVLGNLKRY